MSAAVAWALCSLALVASAVVIASRPAVPAGTDNSSAAPEATALGRLPLSFTPSGKAGTAAFAAATSGGSVALTGDGAVIDPSSPRAEPLEIGLAGGRSADPVAIERLPGIVNDLRGDDPSKWRTSVPTFARVRYPGVYPGIDLDYHGTSGTLEYDFRIAPNADPSRIALEFGGAPTRIAPNGDLLIGAGRQSVRQAAPVSFQPSPEGRIPVSSRFVETPSGIGFEIGGYDMSRPLIIDPLVLAFSTFLGGSGGEIGDGIAADASGVYVTGRTDSADFPGAVGSLSGVSDIFVAKLNPAGTALIYASYIGGSSGDLATDVDVDSAGAAYLTGQTFSGNFPELTSGTYDGDYGGSGDAFVVKLNPSGGFAYSTYLGGNGEDGANAVAVGGDGSAYITGRTRSYLNLDNPENPRYPYPTRNPIDPNDETSASNSTDVFVTKLIPSGLDLDYSTYVAGSKEDEPESIAVDGLGRATVVGSTVSSNYPTTANKVEGYNTDLGLGRDAFVSRLSTLGGALTYSTYLGGRNQDIASDVAVDGDGDVYVVGGTQSDAATTASLADPDKFPLFNHLPYTGGAKPAVGESFIAKIAPGSSSSLVYSSVLDYARSDSADAVAVDGGESVYFAGFTESALRGFNQFLEVNPLSPNASGSAYLSRLAPAGDSLIYQTLIETNAGAPDNFVLDLAIDAGGSAYVTGVASQAAFPTTAGAFDSTYAGGTEAFVSKISQGTPPSDADPPETTITGGPAEGSTTSDSRPVITFSADETSTYACSYDGAAFSACSSPGPGTSGSHQPPGALAPGQHSLSVIATDAASNADPTAATRGFTVSAASPPPGSDTTPPETTITASPPAKVKARRAYAASFTFSSSESGSTFACKLDDGAFSACSSPFKASLKRGAHTFSVRATDQAGNADPSPATDTMVVKRKPKKRRR